MEKDDNKELNEPNESLEMTPDLLKPPTLDFTEKEKSLPLDAALEKEEDESLSLDADIEKAEKKSLPLDTDVAKEEDGTIDFIEE